MSSVRHDVTTPAPPRVEEVSDAIFAYIQPDGSWWINNTGFLVGRRGVLINTHHHGDHSYGNFLFSGATIVGHEARTGILDWGPPRSAPFWAEVEWGGVVVEPPFLTTRTR